MDISNYFVDLPNDFLKRWIQMSNEKPISKEEIEDQYENYEKGMKWQLIQGHIFKENNFFNKVFFRNYIFISSRSI